MRHDLSFCGIDLSETRVLLPNIRLEIGFNQLTGAQPPFLSILVRTQGRRPATLAETLRCLSEQTDCDFEIILLPHKVEASRLVSVNQMVEELPSAIRERTTVITVERDGRAAPLNVGFEHASGQYVSVLDDDDLVFSHWVETFKALARDNVGKVLRACCVEQEIELCSLRDSRATTSGASIAVSQSHDELGVRAVGPLRASYPSSYDFFAHLRENFTPVMCLAFPKTVYCEFGIRFDERLCVNEDWDFGLKSVFACGIAESSEVTSVYRKWRHGNSSKSEHDAEQWYRDYSEIQSRLDAQSHLFPPGTIKYIVSLQERVETLERWGLWKFVQLKDPGARNRNEFNNVLKDWLSLSADLFSLSMERLTSAVKRKTSGIRARSNQAP